MVGAIALSTVLARGALLFMPRPWNDEVMYALVGHQWLQGHAPYTIFWDIKPPLLFGLYALSELATSDPLLGPRILPFIAVFATAIALWRISIAWFGDARMGLIAGLLYPPYSLVSHGSIGVSELLVAPFAAFGLLAAGRSGVRTAFAAGLLLGVAGMVKQTAVFEAILGGLIILSAHRRFSSVVAYAVAGLLPFALFAAWFAWIGHLEVFLQSVLLSALARTDGGGVLFHEGVVLFVILLRGVLPLLVLSSFAVTERRWFQDRDGAHRLWLVGWWVAAIGSALTLRATYGQFLLPLVLPMVLTAALFLAELSRRLRRFPHAAVVLAIGVAWLYAPGWVTWREDWPVGDRGAAAIVGRLNELGLRPGEGQLYVVDHEVALYLLTDTRQPTRFALPIHLTCVFPLSPGEDPIRELDRIMQTRPRFVVVTAERRRFLCSRPERMAVIERHLEEAYSFEGRVGDPELLVDIFRRRDGLPH